VTGATTSPTTALLSAGGVNLVLQFITLASKALLLFGLARYLTPADVGVFGLLVVTLNLAMYAIGLDFYTFTTRELLRRPPDAVPRMLRDQLAFHVATYVVVLPFLPLVFTFGALPWSLAVAFVTLLVVEHLAQEMQRVLITLQRPIHGAVLSFVRGGVWVYIVLALMAFEPSLRTLRTAIVGWITASAASLVGGAYYLRDQPWSRATGAVDWRWIRNGLRIGLPFLGATLALRTVFSIDRYALEASWGAEAVGVYTLYASIRNAIQSLLDMGVMAVLRPKVVRAWQVGDMEQYRHLMRNLTIATTGTAMALCLAAAVGIVPVLWFVGNPVYGEHLVTYWIVLAVTLVAALADVPHTALYAREKDRAIIVSTALSLGAAVVLNLVLVPHYGLPGAALATLSACGVLAAAKATFLRASGPR
jgi:O-antigen/teichoic acid export membrane protein